MSVFGGVHVDIDWTEEGFGSATDAQGDVYSITCNRGIGSAAQEGFVAAAGDATVTLFNRNGQYSRHNTASSLYPNIRGKKPIRLRLSSPLSKVFWVGRIDKIRAGARIDGAPTVVLTCKGNFIRLTDGRKLTPEANGGDTSDVALAALLTSAGFASGEMDLDTGDITMGVWGPVKVGGLEEARKIVGTELGKFFEASDGKATFERRSYRRDTTRSNTIQMTLSDDPGDSAVYRYRGIDQADPEENIFDLVSINFTPTFTLDVTPVRIFAVGGTGLGTIVVPRHGSRVVTINPFLYPFVYPANSAQAEQAGTYYVTEWEDPVVDGSDPTTVGSIIVSDIPGEAAQSALSISNIVTTTHSITFTLSNSDPAQDAVIVYISLFGKRGVIGATVTEQVGSGVREYPLPGPYYPNGTTANTAARWLYDYYSSPRDLLTVNLSGVRSPTLLTALMNREISDRIHVTATESHTNLALDDDFFLESVAWQFGHGGDLDCTLSLSACLPNLHDTEDDTGLPTGMSPYYAFEEASGSIVDIVGGYNLGNHGSTAAVGIIGRARAFAGASNQYALNASSGIPDTDLLNTHEWVGWVKDGGAWAPDQIILQKDIGEDFAYRIYLLDVAGNHYVCASITTDDGIFTTLGSAVPISGGTFHMWRFAHDADLLRIGIALDDGPYVYETYTGTPQTFTTGLVLGGTGSSGGGGTPTADSTTTFVNVATIDPATSLTKSFTNTAGDFLLVGITYARGVAAGITSMTYDGVPLTFLYNNFSGSGTNDMYVGTNTHYHAVGYLVAPSLGTHDLVFTWGGTDVSRIAIGARSFTGVDPLAPFSNSAFAQGNSTAVSATVTSATGELAVDTVGTGQGLLSTRVITGHGAGQTQQYNLQDDNSANGVNAAGSYKSGAASVTMTWTIDTSVGWISVAISLTGTGGSLLPLNATLDETGYMAGRRFSEAEVDEMWNGGAGSTATGGGGIFVPPAPSTPPSILPSGGTTDRPGAPASGQQFFNTDTDTLEYWDGDSWEPAADAVGADIPNAIGTAKGDVIAFTGNAVPVRVGVGSNGKVLTADSTASSGVSWQTTAASRTFDLLTNGVPSAPELVFDGDGNVIWTEV